MEQQSLNRREAAPAQTWKKLLPVLSLKFVLISLLFLAAIFIFGLIAHEAVFEKEDLFDSRVFHFLAAYQTAGFVNVMRKLTFFGSSAFLLPAYCLLVLYFLVKRNWRAAVNIALIALSSTAMLHILKRIFQRQRPDLPLITSLKTYSFPSGHAVSSFIFCMILVHLVWGTNLRMPLKWIAAVMLLLFSMLIGLSRIVLKVHYPTDVLAGLCMGLVWVVLSYWLLERIEKKEVQLKKEGPVL